LLFDSSKRQRTASGRSVGRLQAATPPTSPGRMQLATAAAPACPAASGLGALRLSPPPSSVVVTGVAGSIPSQGAGGSGCGVDYIEQLLQDELTAAMLEELGG
jgi:hypothetical protein